MDLRNYIYRNLDIILEYINTSDHYIKMYDLFMWVSNHDDSPYLIRALSDNLQFIIFVVSQHHI